MLTVGMSTLQSMEVAQLLEALEQIHTPGELQGFPQRMFTVLERLLPDTVLSLEAYDLQLGKGTSAANRLPEKGAEEWAARILELLPSHPVLPYLTKEPNAVVAITDCITQRQFKQTALYADVLKPVGVAFQLVIGLQIPNHAAGMTISRDKDFTEEERILVRILAPHLALAHVHAQNLSTLRNLQHSEVPDPSSLVALGLTPREAEVLHWIIQGKRDSEIAEILRASPRTIQKHVQNILLKLRVETRTTACMEAVRRSRGSQGPRRA
ncbi:MAG: hypothetical protein EOP84_09330 [Verrucomicrobiaceae bacterium]|nr:MAG: hypothetical protein EOP84_09330 [Verrucomicrobiaceae bacterium]